MVNVDEEVPGIEVGTVGQVSGVLGHAEHQPAPLLGQHNSEIFGQELGYPPADLVSLRQHGII